MSKQSVTKWGGVALEEIFGFMKLPGGAAASALLASAFEKRTTEAQEILFEELSQGAPPEMADDDAIYIIYRYLRAAQEGAARINLRLLSQVIAGTQSAQTLTADDFLYYADVISSLRYHEVIILGTFVRHFKKSDKKKDDSLGTAQKSVQAELIPVVFETESDFDESCTALLRTGLITAVSGWGALVYQPTSLLFKFAELLSFDDAVAREKR